MNTKTLKITFYIFEFDLKRCIEIVSLHPARLETILSYFSGFVTC